MRRSYPKSPVTSDTQIVQAVRHCRYGNLELFGKDINETPSRPAFLYHARWHEQRGGKSIRFNLLRCVGACLTEHIDAFENPILLEPFSMQDAMTDFMGNRETLPRWGVILIDINHATSFFEIDTPTEFRILEFCKAYRISEVLRYSNRTNRRSLYALLKNNLIGFLLGHINVPVYDDRHNTDHLSLFSMLPFYHIPTLDGRTDTQKRREPSSRFFQYQYGLNASPLLS